MQKITKFVGLEVERQTQRVAEATEHVEEAPKTQSTAILTRAYQTEPPRSEPAPVVPAP